MSTRGLLSYFRSLGMLAGLCLMLVGVLDADADCSEIDPPPKHIKSLEAGLILHYKKSADKIFFGKVTKTILRPGQDEEYPDYQIEITKVIWQSSPHSTKPKQDVYSYRYKSRYYEMCEYYRYHFDDFKLGDGFAGLFYVKGSKILRARPVDMMFKHARQNSMQQEIAAIRSLDMKRLYRTTSPVGKMTVLHKAAIVGDLDKIKTLPSLKQILNRTDASGMTALHYASLHQHFHVALYLLRAGARADISAGHHGPPLNLVLEHALRTRDDPSMSVPPVINKVMERILDQATAKTIDSYGTRLLRRMVKWGKPHLIKKVLDLGKDINEYQRAYSVPLVHAKDVNTVLWMIQHGAHVNPAKLDSESLLHYFSNVGEFEIVEVLLDKGAYLDELRRAIFPDFWFTLNDKNIKRALPAIRKLAAHGMMLNARSRGDNYSILHYLAWQAKLNDKNRIAAIKVMLELGVDKNLLDAKNKRAYDLARAPAVKTLLK